MPDSLDQEIRTLQSIFWSERDPEGLAFASLADAFRRKGEVREALDLLTDGMSRHPDYATGHVIATRLYRDQGMSSEAEISARRVLELDAENLVALSAMTAILAEKGELGEAARHRTLLMSVDPDSDEARAVAELDLETPSADEPDPTAAVDPAGEVHEATTDVASPPEITDVVAEPELPPEESESLYGDLTIESLPEADSGPDEEELAAAMDALGLTEESSDDQPLAASEAEVAELESELPGPEVELPDLEALGAEEPIEEVGEATDFRGFELEPGDTEEPSEEEPSEEEAVDLAALAPDEPEAEETMDMAALAPDEPEVEDPLDMAALAPDEPEVEDTLGSDQEAVDLATLAPDEPEVDDTLDITALAPDSGREDDAAETVDLAALAPDAPVAEDTLDVAALAPDAPVVEDTPRGDEEAVDLATLAPDETAASGEDIPAEGDGEEDDEEVSEPIYTRTLAELYIKQGFTDKALEVLEALYAMNPHATDLAERIEALKKGELAEASLQDLPSPPPGPPETSSGDGHTEAEVETRARELAEQGLDDSDDVDSPFSWGEPDETLAESGSEPEDEPTVGSYFDELLEWGNRGES